METGQTHRPMPTLRCTQCFPYFQLHPQLWTQDCYMPYGTLTKLHRNLVGKYLKLLHGALKQCETLLSSSMPFFLSAPTCFPPPLRIIRKKRIKSPQSLESWPKIATTIYRSRFIELKNITKPIKTKNSLVLTSMSEFESSEAVVGILRVIHGAVSFRNHITHPDSGRQTRNFVVDTPLS